MSEAESSRVSEALVECRDLTYAYTRGGQKLVVLDHLDLTVQKGDFTALMGPSGSGKTTLLNLIAGLDRPMSGEVRVLGVPLGTLNSTALAEWRASHVGFVFQFYNLLPGLSAVANVELPLLLTSLTRKQRRRHAETALRIVGIEDRAAHKPSALSGGQQQRVAIARAIVTDPTLLVCDEPTGDLDRETATGVLALLQSLNREMGKTIIMVTHDPQAAEYADSVVHLDKGALIGAAA